MNTHKGKTMKIIRVALLVIALAGSTYAGEIPNNITGEIPNNVAGEIPNNVAGDMQNGVTASSPEPTVAEVLLNLLATLIP
jgi:hypothetical protein